MCVHVGYRMEASRLLTEPEIVPMPYVTENTRVTIVLTVTQAYLSEATQFVKRLAVSHCYILSRSTSLESI